jgi:hypothetical protein
MTLIHASIYAFMISLGFVCGILFPQLPWVPLWALSTAGVLAWRMAKAQHQRQLKAIMAAHHQRMSELSDERNQLELDQVADMLYNLPN